jgi:hypothetical protein
MAVKRDRDLACDRELELRPARSSTPSMDSQSRRFSQGR